MALVKVKCCWSSDTSDIQGLGLGRYHPHRADNAGGALCKVFSDDQSVEAADRVKHISEGCGIWGGLLFLLFTQNKRILIANKRFVKFCEL